MRRSSDLNDLVTAVMVVLERSQSAKCERDSIQHGSAGVRLIMPWLCVEDRSFFHSGENRVPLTATVIELQEDVDDEGVSSPSLLGEGSPGWDLSVLSL